LVPSWLLRTFLETAEEGAPHPFVEILVRVALHVGEDTVAGCEGPDPGHGRLPQRRGPGRSLPSCQPKTISVRRERRGDRALHVPAEILLQPFGTLPMRGETSAVCCSRGRNQEGSRANARCAPCSRREHSYCTNVFVVGPSRFEAPTTMRVSKVLVDAATVVTSRPPLPVTGPPDRERRAVRYS
jgi:hypothetical protein